MYNLDKLNNINNHINILQKKTLQINNNQLINLRFQNINYFLNAIQEEINTLNNEINNNSYLNKTYIQNIVKDNNYYNDSIKFLTTLYALKYI